MPFQLFVIFWELDNWPVFVSLEGCGVGAWLERGVEFVVTGSVLGFVSVVAKVVGVEAVSEERTPRKLWVAWKRENEGGRRAE